ncbi:TetR/AcrR family transcriptional regulator [Tardiphaga sp. 804_B3_N1_9]|uniref:TetR/AcrR family transcriptional regulator n=1 Tax=Tardiphaga sp. 804_B3_N1_9 TaxID=3240786 RepID=UPI003F20DD0C
MRSRLPADPAHSHLDIRDRIIAQAEALIRQFGPSKITVVSLAQALGMSPANIYRFFDSKSSIVRAVVGRQMEKVEDAAGAIVMIQGPIRQRLRDLLTEIDRKNQERYINDTRLHELVTAAMKADRGVFLSHLDRVSGIIGELIAEGIEAGELRTPNARLAAACTSTAMLRYIHPQMITGTEQPGITLEEMIDFILASLSLEERRGEAVLASQAHKISVLSNQPQ